VKISLFRPFMEDPTHVSQVADYVIFLICCYVYVAYKGDLPYVCSKG
jgi:hypothetical protein